MRPSAVNGNRILTPYRQAGSHRGQSSAAVDICRGSTSMQAGEHASSEAN